MNCELQRGRFPLMDRFRRHGLPRYARSNGVRFNPYGQTKLVIEDMLRDLASMCLDAWRWQSCNPSGYAQAT